MKSCKTLSTFAQLAETFPAISYEKNMTNSNLLLLATWEQLKAAMEAMEQGLEIQGVTAIEDKLQDGVSDALKSLREAGTKVQQCTVRLMNENVQSCCSLSSSCLE